jgi:hypothetical protein
MDFTGRRAKILEEYTHEFLEKLAVDCPVVRVGKRGRRYPFKG